MEKQTGKKGREKRQGKKARQKAKAKASKRIDGRSVSRNWNRKKKGCST